MSISSNIQSILENDTTVKSLVKKWVKSSVTKYAIFDANPLPGNIKTDNTPLDLTVEDTTINYYQSTPITGAQDFIDATYTINCRAYTQQKAEQLQQACFSALNRVRSSDNKNHFVTTMNPAIPPSDKTDNYNAIVEVRARGVF